MARTDAELDQEIAEAIERGRIADATEPRAQEAYYDRESGRVVIELRDGCMFAFPPEIAQGLQDATPDQLARVEVWGNGYALHWEELDADFTVAGLLAGRFGSRVWMQELGRRGGSSISEAKATAARANGRKGGRPPNATRAKDSSPS